MVFRGFLLVLFVMMFFCRWFGSNSLTQVTYSKSFPNRRVQVGTSDGSESTETILDCATRCLKRQCVGFNFRRNTSDLGVCDVRIGASDVAIPMSVSVDATCDFYGGLEDPLSKYDEFCGPLDKDLTFNCSELSYVPGSCSGKVVCDVRWNTSKRRFLVYASKSATSLLAPLQCCSKDDGEQLARIDSGTVQSWFCHILHNVCGTSKDHAFTFAMYRYTVLGDPWRYLAEGNPKLPDGYYSNFYDPPGEDRCAQMFSGDPYHFKWVQSTCDLATSKGRKYHCVCEHGIQ